MLVTVEGCSFLLVAAAKIDWAGALSPKHQLSVTFTFGPSCEGFGELKGNALGTIPTCVCNTSQSWFSSMMKRNKYSTFSLCHL